MAGSTQNHTTLINEVLANLGVLAAGQPVDPEDFNYVLTRLDPIFRMLNSMEICAVPDQDNIPGDIFESLVDIVSGECAAKFGSQADWLMQMKAMGMGGPPTQIPLGGGAGAMAIKQMRRGRPTLERLRVEYF